MHRCIVAWGALAVHYADAFADNHDFSNGTLTQFGMDLGVFLATRGPYSWLGYGWMGCGCGWEHGGKMYVLGLLFSPFCCLHVRADAAQAMGYCSV